MNENICNILKDLKSKGCSFAVVDERCDELWILVSKLKEFCAELKKCGFSKVSKFKNDIYLYGMTPFMCYKKEGCCIVLCEQLACRSTLNGGWVPLDRKINLNALSKLRNTEGGIPILSPENEICYLLAKSVYTDKSFANTADKINQCINELNEVEFMEKLEGVFFKFSRKILELCKNKQFDVIIKS